MQAYNKAFSIQSCRSCCATQHLCQRSFYKIFVKFRNNKKNVLKIVLIIVNTNKDENKSFISNQISLKNVLIIVNINKDENNSLISNQFSLKNDL
jgi:hypothetical protein